MSQRSSTWLAMVLGAALSAAPMAAVAETMAPLASPAVASGMTGATLVDVRFRGGRGGHGFGGFGGFGGLGLGLLGGVIIGNAIANEGYYPRYDDYDHGYDYGIGYCERRFRSYDPVSRTYLGYDGYRHPCG